MPPTVKQAGKSSEGCPGKTLPPEANTIEDAKERLEKAKKAIEHARASDSPLPKSPFSDADKEAIVATGLTENILVRVTECKYIKDEYGLSGSKLAFTAPLSQVEHGDTDPEALLKACGTNYDKNKTYCIILIDRAKLGEASDSKSFIPTFENLNKHIEANAEAMGLTPETCKKVLNPEFAKKYEFLMNQDFIKSVKWNKPKKTARILSALVKDKENQLSHSDIKLLKLRKKLEKDLSTWPQFQGNGMTRDETEKLPKGATPINGPIETVIYSKKPVKIAELKEKKAIDIIHTTCGKGNS